jgi:hypothetical protein
VGYRHSPVRVEAWVGEQPLDGFTKRWPVDPEVVDGEGEYFLRVLNCCGQMIWRALWALLVLR